MFFGAGTELQIPWAMRLKNYIPLLFPLFFIVCMYLIFPCNEELLPQVRAQIQSLSTWWVRTIGYTRWDEMSWHRSSPLPPIRHHGHPLPIAEHCMSSDQWGVLDWNFQHRPQKKKKKSGYFQSLWIRQMLSYSGLLRHTVLGMAKTHMAFEVMQLLETRQSCSKSFLIQS